MSEPRRSDREGPLAAFVARVGGTRLRLAIHGGAAPALASGSRPAAEGAAGPGTPWPGWPSASAREVAGRGSRSGDRLDGAATFPPRPPADRAADPAGFGPSSGSASDGGGQVAPLRRADTPRR